MKNSFFQIIILFKKAVKEIQHGSRWKFVAKNYVHGNFFVVQNQKYKSLSDILDIKKLMNVDKSIESANRLTEHISELWIEIGRKQDRVHDLNYEISELKNEKSELVDKCRECLEKDTAIARAEFQKEFLENFNPRKIDN